jgi:hypothetical protein
VKETFEGIPPARSTSPCDGSTNCDGGNNDDGNERSQAVKVRRKELTCEARRWTTTGRRDARWEGVLARSDTVGGSFRVCFDCSFEDRLTNKERNSLALQLRYMCTVNQRSSAPVLVDVCGLRRGGTTRLHLENVEGFPDRWEERAY